MGLDDRLNKSGEDIQDRAMNRKAASNPDTVTPRKRQTLEDYDDDDSVRLAEHERCQYANVEM